MPTNPFTTYLDNLTRQLARGNATEHTHRAALAELIQSIASGVTATNEPKRESFGAPDYVVTNAAGLTLNIVNMCYSVLDIEAGSG